MQDPKDVKIEYHLLTVTQNGSANCQGAINEKINKLASEGWRIQQVVATPGESVNAQNNDGYLCFDQTLSILFFRQTKERKTLTAGQALPRG